MLILHTESSHGWGGQELRILTESRELRQSGYDIRIVADPNSLIANRAQDYGVPVTLARLRKKGLADLFAMVRTINRLKPDIICSHSSTDHWLVAVARALCFHKPSILRVRHISAPVNRGWSTRWLYRRGCELVVTTGKSIAQNMVSDGVVSAEKVMSIPTGIDLAFFRSNGRESARTKLIKKISITNQCMIFGIIATLRSWKGHSDLIKAFSKVQQDLTSAKLLIVGDGPMRRALEDLVGKLGLGHKVLFAGHQSDIRDFLDALDIFVFPSYANEGVPQAILQAMAYGLPIITTNIGAISEAVVDYPSAVFVRPRDIAQLSDAMTTLARERRARVVLSETLRKRIGIASMTKQMIGVYKLLEKRRGMSLENS